MEISTEKTELMTKYTNSITIKEDLYFPIFFYR